MAHPLASLLKGQEVMVEESWGELLATQSAESFVWFYERTRPAMFALCSEGLHDPDAALDAVQGAYTRLWQGLKEFAEMAQPPAACDVLLKVATREIDLLRKRWTRSARRHVDLDLVT